MNKQQRVLVAEFIGTFLLASAVFSGFNPFLALAVLVLLIGGISGAHVNPAVSFGLASIGKLKFKDMVPYWAVQVLGALTSIYLLSYLASGSVDFEFADFEARSMVAELVGTAIFLTGITAAITQKLDGIKLAAAVGGSLMLGATLGGGLNPAIGIATGSIDLGNIAGMLIGAVIGASLGSMLGAKSKK